MLSLLIVLSARAMDPNPAGDPPPAEATPAPATDTPPPAAPATDTPPPAEPADPAASTADPNPPPAAGEAPPIAAPPADATAPADPAAPAAEPAPADGTAAPPSDSPPATDAPPAEGTADPNGPPSKIDVSEAEAAPTLTKKFLRFLKPSPYHLPENPRGQIDFTAYTLEWGEVKLGVSNVTVGILPHVQAGTSVPLDVLGIPNVQAKIHATNGGPFDIAAWGEYDRLYRTDFDATLYTVGGITSIAILKPWSVHFGGSYTAGDIAGDISLSSLPQLIWFLDSGGNGNPDHANSLLHVETVSAKFATDVRFNRRDSLILQGSATIYAHVDHSEELWVPEFLGLQDALNQDGFISPDQAGMASIAWQFAWENFEARLGVGVSSIPGAWVLNTWELCYRFGGPTRTREHRMRDTWQKNKEDLKKGPPKPSPVGKPKTD